MAITYTWADADSTSLKYVDDSTTPDTTKFIPVAAGNRDYVAYLAWVDEGNTATAYAYPGYDTDIATARTTRIATARAELKSWIRSNADFDFAVLRIVANSTFTIDATTEGLWDAAYTLLTNFETAINAEADIEDVRLSTIDFDGDSYNIPA